LINRIIESSQRNILDDLNVPDDDHSEEESYKEKPDSEDMISEEEERKNDKPEVPFFERMEKWFLTQEHNVPEETDGNKLNLNFNMNLNVEYTSRKHSLVLVSTNRSSKVTILCRSDELKAAKRKEILSNINFYISNDLGLSFLFDNEIKFSDINSLLNNLILSQKDNVKSKEIKIHRKKSDEFG